MRRRVLVLAPACAAVLVGAAWTQAPPDAVLAALPQAHQEALAKRADSAKVLTGAVPLWSTAMHAKPAKPRTAPVGAVQFSPDGRVFIAIGQEGAGKKFDSLDWNEDPPLIAATVGVATVAWHPRTTYYATSGADGAMRIWRAKSGTKYRFFEGSEEAVYAVAFGGKGKLVAAAGLDGRARVWTVAKGKEICSVSGYGFGLRAIAFTPDATKFVTAGVSEMVELWASDGGAPVKKVRVGPEATADGEDFVVWSVAISPDGARVAAGGSDGKVRMVNLEAGAVKWSLPCLRNVFAVAFSPNGALIAATGLGGEVRLLDAETGETKRAFKVDDHAGFALGWSPKAPYLATIGNDGTAKVWVVPEAVSK